MAKAVKTAPIEVQPGKPATSYLAAAFHYFQLGDAVRTRKFAQQVLAGKATASDAEAAKSLASTFAMSRNLPEDVAAELIERTKVPLKSFAFTGLAAAVFILLLTLAVTRYGA